MEYKNKSSSQLTWRVFALLLTGLWLSIATLAACPSLHHYFHSDSETSSHSCAVTLIAHGKLMAQGFPATLVCLIALLLYCILPASAVSLPSASYALAFGRAPPLPFVSH